MTHVEIRSYTCPMHGDIRQATAGACPKCRMDLLPEGTRFGMLRHMAQKPWMVLAMVASMMAVMLAVHTLLLG